MVPLMLPRFRVENRLSFLTISGVFSWGSMVLGLNEWCLRVMGFNRVSGLNGVFQ